MPKLKFALAVLPSLLVGGGVVAVSLPLPAQAQQSVTDTRALYDRLLRLERDLQDVQRNVYQGGAPAQLGAPAPAADIGATDAARLSLRLDQIETSLRDMTGQVERLQFELRQANQKLENFAADTDFRLRDLEGTGGGQRPSASNATTGGPAPLASSAPTPTEKPLSAAQQASIGSLGGVASTAPVLTPPSSAPRALSSASSAGLPDGGPDVAYKYAMSFLRQGDYPSAEAAFTQFLEAYGDTSLAGNAQYWLGETYYVREQYQDAARAFLTGYQTYASSPKAPDSLLKLGITLAALGQTQDACLTLAEVPRTFPSAPQSVKARAEQERSRAGCV
ncbi:tol-pal system protein YbgF [Pyruvatibacter sp.]|uniref:tol-pal system protein YbgF n=1 Tax=Pyruvatibacter sp. TaxID=1981328 RepID=UPI003262E2BA